MRVPKCQTCHGSGKVTIVGNNEAHYDPWEDPCVFDEVCDECGGTGKDLTVVPPPHPHHENPKAKEKWL